MTSAGELLLPLSIARSPVNRYSPTEDRLCLDRDFAHHSSPLTLFLTPLSLSISCQLNNPLI
ncbi:hypothetical protein J6590_072446 [Homalodisca vitripennis]|nr:hypothetical protein J6590_072446 [Homalodisca vitripennis]